MIKFDIKNRFSGDVQFTAEIDCDENDNRSLKLGLAVRWGIKNSADLSYADLSYADLRSANLRSADLRSANLSYADLRSANLRSADLRSADLSYADLRSANLRSANLRSADLRSANLLVLGKRSDGWDFFATFDDDEIWIRAGCRSFSISDARVHWHETRDGTPLGDETFAILDHAERLVAIRLNQKKAAA